MTYLCLKNVVTMGTIALTTYISLKIKSLHIIIVILQSEDF